MSGDLVLTSIVGYAVGFAVFALVAWFVAPPVGGEWWPYVRVAAALIAGSVGAGVGQLAAFAAVFVHAYFSDPFA